MPHSAEGLLRVCEAAHREGTDFPTVWNTILKLHPLVVGLPTHRVEGGEAQIVVALVTGERLVSTVNGYSLV